MISTAPPEAYNGSGLNANKDGQEDIGGNDSGNHDSSDRSNNSGSNSNSGGNSGGSNNNGGGDNSGDSNNNNGQGNEVGLGDEEAAHLYLHLIVPSTRGTKKQIPIKVTSIANDYKLFLEIRRVYRDYRGSFSALFMVDEIRPRRYELFSKGNVRTFDPSDPGETPARTMPDIVNRPSKYTFSWLPAESRPDPPLLHSVQLTELFYDPSLSRILNDDGTTTHDEQVYLRAPKRTGILQYKPNEAYPVGYGFEFKECFNIIFIIRCELFITSVAIVLGWVYWSVAT